MKTTASEIEEFLNNGGEIKKLPPGPHKHRILFKRGHTCVKDNKSGDQLGFRNKIGRTMSRATHIKNKRKLRHLDRFAGRSNES